MMKKMTLSLLIAGVLSGCSLAPKYLRPDAPVASSYPTQEQATQGDKALRAADIGWRNFFTDPRLQSLISLALNNNRDLRVAALRMEEARGLYNIQSADLLPHLDAVASGSRGRTPASISPTGTSVVSSNYQVGLSLAAFELDFFGRVRSLSDAALASYLATEEAQRAAQISLIAEVAKACLAERSYAEQLVLAKNTYKSRSEAYELSKQRFEVGASSALDLRQDEVSLQTARVAQLTLTRQRAQALNALTLLVGQPLPNDLPAPRPLSDEQIVSDIPAGLPSDLLTQRPDIRSAEQSLLAANANIGAARAAFFPQISLTAGVGTASSQLSGLFDSGSRAWSFAPRMVLPIFAAGANVANLSVANVRKKIEIANYEKAIQTAFREVADALVARGLLDEQVKAQEAVQQAQTERLNLTDARYRNGIASSLEKLQAQRDLFSSELATVQVRLLRLTNAVDLYAALGGGLLETSEPLASTK
jgi:multidrug efflux system outer membrane protein